MHIPPMCVHIQLLFYKGADYSYDAKKFCIILFLCHFFLLCYSKFVRLCLFQGMDHKAGVALITKVPFYMCLGWILTIYEH